MREAVPRDDRDATETKQVFSEIKRVIVGQDHLVERLLVALLSRGHILLEGVPGLAKTLAIKTVAPWWGHLPAHPVHPRPRPGGPVGTRIYNQRSGEFGVELGPVFANLLLADEINRAPAKVQSALLEVMQERQVTIGGQTYTVPDPFLVLATQNPIENEGTYQLPEAQVDRFMFKTVVSYPNLREELVIVDRATEPAPRLRTLLTPEQVLKLQSEADAVTVDARVRQYAVYLVAATRQPDLFDLGPQALRGLRGQPPGVDQPDPGLPGPGPPAGAQLRPPHGRVDDRPGRPAPPHHPLLRGPGRGRHGGAGGGRGAAQDPHAPPGSPRRGGVALPEGADPPRQYRPAGGGAAPLAPAGPAGDAEDAELGASAGTGAGASRVRLPRLFRRRRQSPPPVGTPPGEAERLLRRLDFTVVRRLDGLRQGEHRNAPSASASTWGSCAPTSPATTCGPWTGTSPPAWARPTCGASTRTGTSPPGCSWT